HTVVVTPTASGKTLCCDLAVIDGDPLLRARRLLAASGRRARREHRTRPQRAPSDEGAWLLEADGERAALHLEPQEHETRFGWLALAPPIFDLDLRLVLLRVELRLGLLLLLLLADLDLLLELLEGRA